MEQKNQDVPLEIVFKWCVKDYKDSCLEIGKLKSYIQELEYKVKEQENKINVLQDALENSKRLYKEAKAGAIKEAKLTELNSHMKKVMSENCRLKATIKDLVAKVYF